MAADGPIEDEQVLLTMLSNLWVTQTQDANRAAFDNAQPASVLSTDARKPLSTACGGIYERVAAARRNGSPLGLVR
ncbi:MAG TPA: hypothetical protein VMB21_20935 [Candidatus Limnocylindria bacterium]|nr:hypothetical protein [Candidatus Limnocylindria bacterium]